MKNKILIIALIFTEFLTYSQTEIIVNRRRNEDPQQERTIPRNDFSIKESNDFLSLSSVLSDHPLTRSFAQNIDIRNAVPTRNETTFVFDTTLSLQDQENAIKVIKEYRDKSIFSELELFNISAKEKINEALEQVGDIFDEESIKELILPNFCDLRNDVINIYESKNWDDFSVGEKRILIGDWLVPTNEEVLQIFQGGNRRSEIYRLFGSKASDLYRLELIRSIEEGATQIDGEDFTNYFQRVFSIGKADLSNKVFVSRSNRNSNNVEVGGESQIPFFGNIRQDADFITIINDTTAVFNERDDYLISYNVSVNSGNNVNYSIAGHRIRNGSTTNLDGQGITTQGRGRSTLIHVPVEINLRQNDTLFFKLKKDNTNTGNLNAASNRCYLRIEKKFK